MRPIVQDATARRAAFLRIAIVLAALLACTVAALSPLGPARALAASTGTVQATSTAVTSLTAVACEDATRCVAVGGSQSAADVVPVNSGIPATPQPVAGVARLSSVGCWSTTDCLATGTSNSGGAVVVPITDGSPRAAEPVPGAGHLTGISCTAGGCVAVGDDGNLGDRSAGVVVTITRGAIGVPVAAQGVWTFSSVGCSSAADCVGWGVPYPQIGGIALVHIVNGIPAPTRSVAGTGGSQGLACAGSQCVGVNGGVVPISGGVPGTPEPVSPASLVGVSCLSDGACLAVGSDSAVAIENGVPMVPEPVAGVFSLDGVFCLSTGCVAVGVTASQSSAAVVTLAAPPPPSGQKPPTVPIIDPNAITSFSFQSSPGDPVGQGASGRYTLADASFLVGSAVSFLPTPSTGIGFQVRFGTTGWWSVHLMPPAGQQLQVGTTYAATGDPFFTPWRSTGAGLMVDRGSGSSCEPSTFSSFTLGSMRTDAQDVIQQFTLSFRQSCYTVGAPPLTGSVEFNVPRPPGWAPPAATAQPAPRATSDPGPEPPAVAPPPAIAPPAGARGGQQGDAAPGSGRADPLPATSAPGAGSPATPSPAGVVPSSPATPAAATRSGGQPVTLASAALIALGGRTPTIGMQTTGGARVGAGLAASVIAALVLAVLSALGQVVARRKAAAASPSC